MALSREATLAELARHTGKRVPASFIQRTSEYISGIERFHPLYQGIYKPARARYALAIKTSESGPYADEVIGLPDGRWLMRYKPRSGERSISDNQALIACMTDGIPVGVVRKLVANPAPPAGVRYLVMGLGIVTGYDASSDVFIVESATLEALEKVESSVADPAGRYEVELYAQLSNEFRPFEPERKRSYTVTAEERAHTFRGIILREYDSTCAVCEMKYREGEIIEAQAAHIIEKRAQGTDDPRNGLSLCHTHHWAFDEGLFTVDPDYRVSLSPTVKRADTRNFGLLDMNGKPIQLPAREAAKPHSQALIWHREHRFQN